MIKAVLSIQQHRGDMFQKKREQPSLAISLFTFSLHTFSQIFFLQSYTTSGAAVLFCAVSSVQRRCTCRACCKYSSYFFYNNNFGRSSSIFLQFFDQMFEATNEYENDQKCSIVLKILRLQSPNLFT